MRTSSLIVCVFMVALLGVAGWIIDGMMVDLRMARTELKLVEEIKRTMTKPQWDQDEARVLVEHYLAMLDEVEGIDPDMTAVVAYEAWQAKSHVADREYRESVANRCRPLFVSEWTVEGWRIRPTGR